MKKGDKLACAVLQHTAKGFVPTGAYVPVEVREVKPDAGSVRVKQLFGKRLTLWVQAQMLRPISELKEVSYGP